MWVENTSTAGYERLREQEPLVSIIMPAYNSEKHIAEAIESVQSQTFSNWELLITDDCSTDETASVVKKISCNDSRIKYVKQSSNQGAAIARNASLNRAKGRFIGYLDADDIWFPEKLEDQITFMKKGGYAFSCASYTVIDEEGKALGRTVTMPDSLDRWGFLTHNYLQTVGIMVDLDIVDRSLLYMPNIRRRQDAATWLQILSAGYSCHGISKVLCGYRRVSGSLSSNKIKAIRGMWYFYRQIAKLPLPQAYYCFARYAVLAIWKRTYTKKQSHGIDDAEKE
jgi:teichuronic acid biosynthesis glycosyltransferase TuaG